MGKVELMPVGGGAFAPARFAVGAGPAANLARNFDWASTPLGPPSTWPAELRTAASFVLESGFPAAVIWGPGLTTIYNDAFRPILGDKPEAMGRSFADIWAEAWDEIGPIARRALAGEATYIEDFPLTIDRFGYPEQAWFTFSYSPLRLADGTVAGMMDTVVETTATVRGRAELKVLNHELAHRLKNTLATIQAIASQTLRDVSEREAVHALSERIVAMGAAHDVLVRHHWTGGSVRQLAEATLASFDDLERIVIDGPELEINAQAAIALAMLLHELSTNAVKYGALSVPTGRVRLSWHVEGETLVLRWREEGGPAVREPGRRGFGSRLLEMGLCAGGSVERRYPRSGFEADIAAPLADIAAGSSQRLR